MLMNVKTMTIRNLSSVSFVKQIDATQATLKFIVKHNSSVLRRLVLHRNLRNHEFAEAMISGHKSLFRKRFGKVTHCLFDMDGTVIATELMYHQVIREICEKYNRKFTNELQLRVHGMTDRELCLSVVKDLKMPITADQLEEQMTALARNLLPTAPLKQGAERLITHLYTKKIPIALATNSTEAAVQLHTRAKPKLFGLFHHKVSASDPEVDRGKPNPDIYLVAAARFPDKPQPAKCLVFEDSPIGVEAARGAGMQVVMIPEIALDTERLRNATLVLPSLRDFKPELFGLPPYDTTNSAKVR